MKEQDLIDLGFIIKQVSEEDSGGAAFHYYTYDIFTDSEYGRSVCFISCSNDEVDENGNWVVQLFEYSDFEFKKKEDVQKLIYLFEQNKVR